MHPRFPIAAVLAALFATTAVAQDPLVKQALARIERVEQQEPALQAGDTKTGNQLLADLAWAAKRLNAVVQQTDQHWQDAGKRLAAVQAKVEAKAKAGAPPATGTGTGFDPAQLAQLDKEIGHAIENFRIVPRNLQADPARQKATQAELDGLERRLAGFPVADAAVAKVAARCAEFRALVTASVEQTTKDRAGSEAVARGLAALDTKYRDDAVPGELSYPYSEEQLRAWAAEVLRWRDTEIPHDLAFLGEAAQNAVVDQQHVSRLRHWLTDLRDRTLVTSTRTVADRLQGEVKHGLDLADWILATDAADPDQVANRILGKGRFDENMARLRDCAHAVEMARVHDLVMTGKWMPERDEQAQKATKALSHLQQLAVSTLDAVRMPTPASTDAELLQIAATTLRQPGYGVGEWLRLVIHTEKVRHESREAWVQGGNGSATISYHHYVWDQFQVTTAERDASSGEVWLFANTLKRYESGDPTKKLGQWILSQRFELTRIRPENVER